MTTMMTTKRLSRRMLICCRCQDVPISRLSSRLSRWHQRCPGRRRPCTVKVVPTEAVQPRQDAVLALHPALVPCSVAAVGDGPASRADRILRRAVHSAVRYGFTRIILLHQTLLSSNMAECHASCNKMSRPRNEYSVYRPTALA